MTVDTDLVFVVGIIVGLLAFPALLTAYSEGRTPRAAALLVLLCVGMVSYSVVKRPSGYSIGEVPEVFKRVFIGAVE